MGLDSEHVHKPVRKLRKLLKKMPRQPTPEHVHQLRTNSRRLETMLESLALDRREHRLLKGIAKIRRKAGGVRDMDVLIGYVPGVRNNGREECRVRLLEHLGDTRRKEAKKLYTVAARKRKQVRAALKRVDRRLEKSLCEKQGRRCDSGTTRSQATAAALVLESQLMQPNRLTRQNLHPYRLKVKELQNVLRLGEGSENQEFLKALGVVKQAIGEWHDWEELRGIAEEVLHNGSECELIREIRNLCQQKYEKALAQSHRMREKYLKISSTKGGHAFRHAANPVWEATAVLAS
jgi:CHAD domain-containing protein